MLQLQIERVMDVYRAFYEKTNDQMSPFCTLFDRDGEITTILQMPMGNDEQKDQGVLALTMAMVATKSFGYVFTSEAWLKVISKAEAKDGIKVMPRDSEDRREVVIVEAHTYDEDLISVFDIVRDWNTGNVTDLVKNKDMDGGQMQSRFNIFPPREVATGTKH